MTAAQEGVKDLFFTASLYAPNAQRFLGNSNMPAKHAKPLTSPSQPPKHGGWDRTPPSPWVQTFFFQKKHFTACMCVQHDQHDPNGPRTFGGGGVGVRA